jgi:hypothetical protein
MVFMSVKAIMAVTAIILNLGGLILLSAKKVPLWP